MKNTSVPKFVAACLLLAAVIAGCESCPAQTVSTNPPAATATALVPPALLNLDFVTNLPTAASFQVAKFGLNVGLLTRAGAVENLIKGDGYYRTNWMLSLEIQNAPSSTVIDSLSAYAGYRHAWPNGEIYLQGGGRRTWTTDAGGTRPNWQGAALFGAAYVPTTGGKLNLFCDVCILTSQSGNALKERPSAELRAGTKFIF